MITKKIITLILMMFLPILGCKKENNQQGPQGFIQIKGSDTIVNAVQKVSEEFMKEYPYVFVAITGGGSGVGVASLINKTCNIATMSREIKTKEIDMAHKKGVSPKEFIVGFDGVAVIVNKNNPVEKLTIEDLHKIFTGEVTNWKNFGGKDLHIVNLSREVSSGTYSYFKDEIIKLGDKNSTQEFSNETLLLSSSQAIVEEVSNNDAAIGYLGMGYVSDRTKSLSIGKKGSFYPPTLENVINKTYLLSRPLYYFTNGEPNGVTKLFIDFTLSPKGQQQFKETGFVPVKTDDAKKN